MRRRSLLAGLLLGGGLAAGGWVLVRADHPSRPIVPTRLFEQVLSHVQRFGVDSVSEAELYRRAASGLLWQLDDEQAMLLPAGTDPTTLDAADPGGLGLLLATRDGVVEVLGVVPGSPADDGGLRAGDLLFEVDGQPLDPNRRLELRGQLAGAAGTTLRLTFRRPGLVPIATARLQRGMPAGAVVLPGPTFEDGIGYIAVPLLGPGAAGQLEAALEAQVRGGARRLILDLRGASSGSLTVAVEAAALFLPEGTPVVRVEGRTESAGLLTTSRTPTVPDLPMVVLVDEGTADAAEVLAAALQEADRALLLGADTFGRGRSVGVFSLGSRLSIRLSTGRWITPQGRVIQAEWAPTDSGAGLPPVRSAGGRALAQGRGVLPDSLMPADSLDLASRTLLQLLGDALPAFHDSLRAVVRRAPNQPIPELRAMLGTAAPALGLRASDLEEASGYVSGLLAAEVARRRGGAAALIAERVRGDAVVARARTLLRGRTQSRDLLGLR